MRWLKKILRETAVVRPADDDAETAGPTAEMEFVATLQLTTPLRVLERHGEIFNGPPDRAPLYCSPAQGAWVPKSRLEADEDPFALEEMIASDLGDVVPSQYLAFLLAFREIVESGQDPEQTRALLGQLPGRNPAFAAFWQRATRTWHDFPEAFVSTPEARSPEA